jgi:phycoerythrobilin:ferredoxin oxidoreductase
MDTVNTVVWEAFREYTDLYMELMSAVQCDVDSGILEFTHPSTMTINNNPVWMGQLDYLEYRRTNDPARPMLQRLYGNEWSESVIGDVLFPDL